jgi:hypothetical protein
VDQSDRDLTLRLAPDQEPVLQLRSGVGWDLRLPAGQSEQGAFVAVKGPSGAVAAWIAGSDVAFYSRESIVFGGYAIPRHNTRLHWLSAAGAAPTGRLSLTFEPDQALVPIAAPLATVGCASLALRPLETVDIRADIGPVQYWAELSPGKVSLSVEASSPPAATLHLTRRGPRYAGVHRRDGAQVRVVHYGYRQLAFGWIDGSYVTRLPRKPPLDFGHGYGSGRGGTSSGGHWVQMQCPAEVPLVLHTEEGRTVTIGHLDGGARFRALWAPGPPTGTYRTVKLLDGPWVEGIADAWLAVREIDLARCSRP